MNQGKRLIIMMLLPLIISIVVFAILMMQEPEEEPMTATEEVAMEEEESDIPWYFIVLIFAVSFGVMFFAFKNVFKYFLAGSKRKEILAKGRPAKAKIVNLGESGKGTVTVNNQPFVTMTLEVMDGDKPPYKVKLQTIVSRLALPQFQPGAVISIKIDPKDPNNVVIDSGGQVTGGEKMPTYESGAWTEEDKKIVAERGIKGKAKILNIEDTGKSKDFNPIIRMTYEVKVENKEPYTLSKELPMPSRAAQFNKTFIGKTVPATIHPENKEKVILEFKP